MIPEFKQYVNVLGNRNLSIFIISQDYYELSKRTIRLIEVDVQNLYQDQASIERTQ